MYKRQEPETDVTADDAPRKPVFEEFQWNVEDYPARAVEKTEDIDFDWSADPREIPDTIDRSVVSESVSNTAESDDGKAPVSYTHLDVYKRQSQCILIFCQEFLCIFNTYIV